MGVYAMFYDNRIDHNVFCYTRTLDLTFFVCFPLASSDDTDRLSYLRWRKSYTMVHMHQWNKMTSKLFNISVDMINSHRNCSQYRMIFSYDEWILFFERRMRHMQYTKIRSRNRYKFYTTDHIHTCTQKPRMGIEPITSPLPWVRSTDWTIAAPLHYHQHNHTKLLKNIAIPEIQKTQNQQCFCAHWNEWFVYHH